MTKKIALGLVALVAMAAGVVGLSAFEAHVINVTAKIENALLVDTRAIDFGTVFPQEELEQTLELGLSRSFRAEDRVDDVEYIIRQKPKCGVTSENGTILGGPTWTGHVVVGAQGAVTIDCEQERPDGVTPQPNDLDFYLLPSLCEYISKHPDGIDDEEEESDNDGSLNSFHKPYTINPITGAITWTDVKGRLAKSDNDTTDTWTIDLAVPCFGDFCAQDWEDFVRRVSGNSDIDADQYTQPIENEHKIFGCNLWIEVNEVSEAPTTGTLNVNKIVVESTADESTFSFTVDAGAPIAFEGDGTNSIPGVSAGAHTVVEVAAPGFTSVVDCGGGPGDTSVVVPAGGSASCTITNTFVD